MQSAFPNQLKVLKIIVHVEEKSYLDWNGEGLDPVPKAQSWGCCYHISNNKLAIIGLLMPIHMAMLQPCGKAYDTAHQIICLISRFILLDNIEFFIEKKASFALYPMVE